MDSDEDAIRRVVLEAIEQRGWTVADLARHAQQQGHASPYQRLKKALDGVRGLTPGTIHLIAKALDTTPIALRRRAGAMTKLERQVLKRRMTFDEYLAQDPLLSTEDKRVLRLMYRRIVGDPRQQHFTPMQPRKRNCWCNTRTSEHAKDCPGGTQ